MEGAVGGKPLRPAHRRGHQRAWVNALEQGYGVYRETFRRLWREEGLRVLPRRKRKRVEGSLMSSRASTSPLGLTASLTLFR